MSNVFSVSVHKTIEVLKLMCVFAIAITLVYLSFQMHKSNQLQKLYSEEVLLKKTYQHTEKKSQAVSFDNLNQEEQIRLQGQRIISF